jgi:hypothetical protein
MAALSVQVLGRSAQLRADFDTARRLLEETLSAYRKSRTSENIPSLLFDVSPLSCLAQIAREQGNTAEALVRAEEAMGRKGNAIPDDDLPGSHDSGRASL